MSGTDSASPPGRPGTGGGRWGFVVVAALAVAAVVVVAVLVFGDDDVSAPGTTADPSDTTGPGTTADPSTTASTAIETPVGTEPATTAPAATEAPATSDAPPNLEFTVADIDDGGTIPIEFTCDGDNTPPTVTVESTPDGVVQLALIVDDPDAPRADPFVHWVVYGIPSDATEITDGDRALTYGVNDAGTEEWFGPCPPEGDGPHEYHFTLYALDEDLDLESGLDGRAVAEAIADATAAETAITAGYERAGG